MTNFIHTIEGALSAEACTSLINQFEKSTDLHGPGHAADESGVPAFLPDVKISTDISIDFNYQYIPGWEAVKDLNLALNNGIEEYKKKYETVDKIGSWKCYRWWNIQRYKPGEGYFEWHCEAAGMDSNSRIMAWMFYLNDVKEGGETEFLNQAIRIKPKKGRVVVFPAGFPYVHRGNSPLSGEKYILTSWMLLR